MDRAVAGEFEDLEEALANFIDLWHVSAHEGRSLVQYLGMTEAEYSEWVECVVDVDELVERRRQAE